MSSKRLNLALIFGGRSGEHEISVMSARSVLQAIDTDKYQVWQIGITREGHWLTGENTLQAFENKSCESLKQVVLMQIDEKTVLHQLVDGNLQKISAIDVFFPILHGTYGEDGTIQGYFEMLDVAYVGAGLLSSSVGMDKGICKDLVANLGVPVLEYKIFNRQKIEVDLEATALEAEKIAPYPLFVKPANLGSSVGISKAKNRQELIKGLEIAAKYDRRVLVERGINAREIEVSVLGNTNPIVSTPGEIIPGDEFYSYDDKYIDGIARTFVPADLSDAMTQRVQEIALQVYQGIDCAGMARVDFLIDKQTEEIFFSEINTIPGFTPISMFPKLLAHGGITYPELIDRLIALALERKADRDKTIRSIQA